MKEIDGKRYYNIDEIHTKLKGKVEKEQIRKYFECKHLQGI